MKQRVRAKQRARVNALACRDALLEVVRELGLATRIGVVFGDDLEARADGFRVAGVREMFSGEAFRRRRAARLR